MKKFFGQTRGLKPAQLKQIAGFYRYRVPTQAIVTHEICLNLCFLSKQINRQIGLLINRNGKVNNVVLGNSTRIVIPDLRSYRLATNQLRGVRCVHTHLNSSGLSKDDLADLLILRLDVMAAITTNKEGTPGYIYCAYISTDQNGIKSYELMPAMKTLDCKVDCIELVTSIEDKLSKGNQPKSVSNNRENAVLVSIYSASREEAMDSLNELKELSETASINVLDAATIAQKQKKLNYRLFLSQDKLDEIALVALNSGASLIIFDQELNPSENRIISERTKLKIIDRTQLILGIFAQRAKTSEGKIQVELAQMKYMMPRLTTKNTDMSRLTGGIGRRGPGETKLEINKRYVRKRIHHLERSIEAVKKIRKQQRKRRKKQGIPIVSIVGYTNVGKSTLLKTITKSSILVENKLFATLDPTSRSIKFPKNQEIIITDTVGFIRNLPKDLIASFMATLEELRKADLLLHLIDISNPRFEDQINSVESILADLSLSQITTIRVLNKKDLLSEEIVGNLCDRFNGVAISALDANTLHALINKIKFYTKVDNSF